MKYMLMILASCMTMSATAAIQVANGEYCNDLIAGQHIDAGDICATVVGDQLEITYTTTGGWELAETHLWVGTNFADMPQTKKGNPKLGNFPYNSGDISGTTTYTTSIPLSLIGTEAELCDPNKLVYIVAHAAVRKDNGDGSYQSETGYGSGDPIVDRGSWAMYYTIQFDCNSEPPQPKVCETAFAVGDIKLWDILDINGDPITNRWGWQVTVAAGDNFSTPIYAGAGQNDLNKGTYVGDLVISYDGTTANVTFNMIGAYTMDETHLYAGTVHTDTAAPGQYGNLHDLSDATNDSYSIAIAGGSIYIVAHAVVCGF